MTLHFQNGKILMKNGQFCTTCCAEKGLQDFVSMCWIDEAHPIYYPEGYEAWNRDIALLDSVVDGLEENDTVYAFGVFKVAVGKQPPWKDIKPRWVNYPSYVTAKNCSRAPSAATFKKMFRILKGKVETAGKRVDRAMFTIDDSGSMRPNTIEPAYSSFVSWVKRTYPDIEIIENTFINERWIAQLVRYVS
jgi:hypothetical protein